MPPDVRNAAPLVETCHALAQLPPYHLHALVHRQGCRAYAIAHISLYIAEYPRRPDGGTPYHDAIHAIAVEAFGGTLGGRHVAIAYDGDVHPGIVFHLAYQSPVGLAGVHLAAGTPVYGQSRYAAILQLLGQLYDNLRVMVPAQPCLHGDRHLHGIDDPARNSQHLGYIAQHAGAGAFAGDLLHRAAEVDVYHIGMRLLAEPGCLYHRLGEAAVYLYRYGTLGIDDVQLALCCRYVPHQSIGRHKLGIYHIGAKLLAHQPERGIGYIFHGSQQHGTLAQIYVSYPHALFLFRFIPAQAATTAVYP